MADTSRVYKLSDGLDAAAVGRGVEGFLRDKKGMIAEGAKTPEGYFVQAKGNDDGWKKFAGMSKAIQVQIIQTGEVLNVNIGNGKWSDKVGAGAVGMLVFAPLAVTAAIGAVGQNKLPGEILDFVETFIVTGGKTASISMSASTAVKEGMVVCPKCKTQNEKGTKFCEECGEPLAMKCPECGVSVPLGKKFCPDCGASMAPKNEEIKCPNCGEMIPAGKKFCAECGTKLD